VIVVGRDLGVDAEPLGAAHVLLHPALTGTGTGLVLEAVVDAAHPGGELVQQGGLPVENDLADLDLDAGRRPHLGQGLLDAEAGEAVGEVAGRLLVVEVRLLDPALGLGAADDEDALFLVDRVGRRMIRVDTSTGWAAR
jgi:hypothetical protein